MDSSWELKLASLGGRMQECRAVGGGRAMARTDACRRNMVSSWIRAWMH